MNGLGFFVSSRNRVYKNLYGTIDNLVRGLEVIYDECDTEILERVLQSLSHTYNQALKALGRNDFNARHSGIRNRRRQRVLD